MSIIFSRHAKRRMLLYNIDESDVVETIRNSDLDIEGQNKIEVVNKEMADKYGYPLKVVFTRKNDDVIVISAFPFIRRQGA
jgi:hypothetical protein